MGQVLHLPTTVESWADEDGKKRSGRPRKTWQDNMNEDVKEMGLG